MNKNITKRTNKILRELVDIALEKELRRALQPLADAFEKWKRNEITSKDIYEKTHEFHQGPARNIYYHYNQSIPRHIVAQAIAGGILDSKEVPPELFEHLSNTIKLFKELDKIK